MCQIISYATVTNDYGIDDSIYEEIYEEGYFDGSESGYDEGYNEGYDDGYAFAYEFGYNEGYNDAKPNSENQNDEQESDSENKEEKNTLFHKILGYVYSALIVIPWLIFFGVLLYIFVIIPIADKIKSKSSKIKDKS